MATPTPEAKKRGAVGRWLPAAPSDFLEDLQGGPSLRARSARFAQDDVSIREMLPATRQTGMERVSENSADWKPDGSSVYFYAFMANARG